MSKAELGLVIYHGYLTHSDKYISLSLAYEDPVVKMERKNSENEKGGEQNSGKG